MGWRKLFYNPQNTGTFSIEEPASWSRTPLENMWGCELQEGPYKLSLRGLGEYWQSDTYISSPLTNGSNLIQRRIQKKIDCAYAHLIDQDNELKITCLSNDYETANLDFTNQQNCWLVLEIDMITMKRYWYISKDRI